MVSITTDICALTTLQREQLASFILTFGITQIDPAVEDACEEFTRQVTSGKIIPADIDAATAFGSPLPVTLVVPPPPVAVAGPALVIPAPVALEVDKSGASWDASIHSSSKALTADGMWRKKRGAGEVAPVAAMPSAPPPPAPVAATPAVPPPPSGEQAKATPADYVTLIGIASAAVASGKLTLDEVAAAAVNAGVKAPEGVAPLQALSGRLDLVATVTDEVNRIIASRAA